MNAPNERTFAASIGGHSVNINYTDWGDSSNPRVLFCAHGLTRNCRDFDYLASHLQDRYRIICLDFPGRGRSGWLPAEFYAPATYIEVVLGLLKHLGVQRVQWLGTSMGGILGMLIGGSPASPIERLIINDVGPVFRKEPQIDIAKYTGNDERFKDLKEAEKFFRRQYSELGDLPDEEWDHFTRHSTQKLEDGMYCLAYDPNISALAKRNIHLIKDSDIWPAFESIQCPILVLHGVTSKVLAADIVEEMKRRGKNVAAVDIEGVGHAPALRSEAQVELIASWLTQS